MTQPQRKPKTPIPSDWNTDIYRIPKGKWVNETRKVKDSTSTVKVWHPDKLWVIAEGRFMGTDKTRVVIRTYWIPDESRWCCFTKDTAKFLAWMPYRELIEGEAPPRIMELENVHD